MQKRKIPFDLHQHVTDQIIKAIEEGAGETKMPWQRLGIGNAVPANAHTSAEYRGVNILSLWASTILNDFPRSIWATFRQWKKLDCQVRKGEKGSCVIFYKEFEVDRDPGKPNDDGLRRVARASWVFNASQVEDYELPDIPDMPPVERINRAENLVGATKADIHHGGDRAFYRPDQDFIQMPDDRLFNGSTETKRSTDYYAILLHELTHWTSSSSRLDRQLGKRFGDEAYAMEELVAELGSAFLCAELGITRQPREDHASYIANWLQVLKDDKRAIFTAAARASEAASYIRKHSKPS